MNGRRWRKRTKSPERISLLDGLLGLGLKEAKGPRENEKREAAQSPQLGNEDSTALERRRFGRAEKHPDGFEEGYGGGVERRDDEVEPFLSGAGVPQCVGGREIETELGEGEEG